MRVTARREGGEITVEAEGATGPWSVLLRGVDAVASVKGGAASVEPLGTRVVSEDGAAVVRITL